MPLIIFCGYPSSGKTTAALELQKYIQDNHKKEVVIVNEESLHLVKTEAYKDYTQEKMTRGFLKSNTEKALDQNTVVILDSLNYIKGFRYELFCLARKDKTPHLVVFFNTSKELCEQYCLQNQNGFSKEMFEDFFQRMEVPNMKNRWDSPLIELRDNEQVPFEKVCEIILFSEKKSKDPISTKQENKYETNYVYELEKRVQQVIEAIIDSQEDQFLQGQKISIKDTDFSFQFSKKLSVIELKRFKLEYLKICRQTNPTSLDNIYKQFVTYLNSASERL